MNIVIPHTSFERAALRYVRHHRALGKLYNHEAWVLGHLAGHLSERQARDLDASQFESWLRCQQHTSGTTRRGSALIVHKFCRYRERTEPTCFVPDPLYFPRRVPSVLPVILGPAQIARMLETIEGWPANSQHPLYRATYRIAVVLLYTAGLRRGELIRLTLNDLDFENTTLRIRESKFHKTRIVPLSSSASRELRRYLKARLAPPWDISAGAPLLGDQHGSVRFRAYVPAAISQGVHKLFRDADIRDPHGRYPRVHDLRHSFAVQALLRWYRAGVDVQAKLPQLSMYMGHVSIVSTAHYLHFIPEVASAANRLFARHFGRVALGGVR
jgi:integrase/recombinase XerD